MISLIIRMPCCLPLDLHLCWLVGLFNYLSILIEQCSRVQLRVCDIAWISVAPGRTVCLGAPLLGNVCVHVAGIERYAGDFGTLAEAPNQLMLILHAWRPKLVLFQARAAVPIFRLMCPLFRVP